MRVLELFAGCGGASLGLERAGFRPVACVERDEAAVATLAAAGMPALLADVNDVDLTPFAGVELLWASPPCQPGSTAGKRRGAADPRDGWPATLRALDVVRPTWFLAENVVGWTFHGEACGLDGSGCAGCAWDGSIVPAIRARFAFHGELRLNAADFGVPQHRRRVVLWGGPLPIVAPTPTHGTPSGRGGRRATPSATSGSTRRPANPAPATHAMARTGVRARRRGAWILRRQPS